MHTCATQEKNLNISTLIRRQNWVTFGISEIIANILQTCLLVGDI
jgi:hypothetical protein